MKTLIIIALLFLLLIFLISFLKPPKITEKYYSVKNWKKVKKVKIERGKILNLRALL